MTEQDALTLAKRLLGNLVHYRHGGSHELDDQRMLAQTLRDMVNVVKSSKESTAAK